MRPFHLHKRKSVYYVQFVDRDTGTRMSALSTGKKDRDEALLTAAAWLKSGVPMRGKTRPAEELAGAESVVRLMRKTALNADDALRIVDVLKSMGLIDTPVVKNTGRGAEPFTRFLETFWDYDKSEYIQDRLSHGYRFSRRYARECLKRLRSDVKPFFGDKKLNCVTAHDLKELARSLAARGLATSTVSLILLVCATPLKWACSERIIPSNPAVGLTKFSIVNKERGVLTEAEAAAVFAVQWPDKRARAASLVAATTGARQGEILALRRSDIRGDTLAIAHSWSPLDGLKCPKNGHKRIAPLLPEVRAALLDLLNGNPHGGDDPFIFYSLLPGRPVDQKVLVKGLEKAIEKANALAREAAGKEGGAEPEIFIDRKARNIVFHSWRHFFCSKITEAIEGEKAAKVSGHLSDSVFKKYADHIEAKNVKEVGDAAAKVFGGVLPGRAGG